MSRAVPGENRGWVGPGLLFALLRLAWGSTLLVLKVGVSTMPPLPSAALRFLAAAVLLLAPAAGYDRLSVPLSSVVLGAGLLIASNYGLMAWGITQVPSRVPAVINLPMVPMATLAPGLAHGRTRFSAASGAALLAGVGGLALLLRADFRTAGIAGMAAIAAGSTCDAWGAVLTQQRLAANRSRWLVGKAFWAPPCLAWRR